MRQPIVGETWCGRTHPHQRVEILEVIPDHQALVWKGLHSGIVSREQIQTFTAYWKPEDVKPNG